jgi:polyhydroxyalkanoate synthase subunit PhaC
MWSDALKAMQEALRTPLRGTGTRTYDPLAFAGAMNDFAFRMASHPETLVSAYVQGAQQWGDFWLRAMTPSAPGAAEAKPKRKDRRFASKAWEEDPWYRSIRDSYLLASDQLHSLVDSVEEDSPDHAMVRVLLDSWLNAVAPTNYVMTNPDVVARTVETKGANLANGFANLLEDLSEGKGIVRRRSDPNAFEKGVTIAATPGQVVHQAKLFQLIQYDPVTPDVAAEPLLYIPPLVNRFYMIDLVPRQSLVKWLTEQGRTVFVISWVNATEEHRGSAVEDYILSIVEAIETVTRRTEAKPDLFSFCLGGTLAAITLAYLKAQGRGDEVNSATMIGSMVDFADMKDWAAFVHEAHLDAMDAHLAKQGYIDAAELQRLFSAMRANDLIWSSVVNHYLLDKEAPPSDLLYWFEDGARIPAAFLSSYNRELLHGNRLREPGAFEVKGVPIDLTAIDTPLLSIALKDDHVSSVKAVYDGARLLKADFVLGGSGHNAGVINPPAANKHGFWTNDVDPRPDSSDEWLASSTRHEGSWWPWWQQWHNSRGSGERVPARTITDGIEPAPGSYAKAP